MKRILLLAVLVLGIAGAVSAGTEKKAPKVVIDPAGACGTFAHCAVLTWTGSAGATGYNVFEGSTSGGESSTPVNGTPVTATTYIYQITPTNSVQNLFFYVEAVETSGTVTLSSVPSNEVSGTFPGLPTSPVVQPISIPQ